MSLQSQQALHIRHKFENHCPRPAFSGLGRWESFQDFEDPGEHSAQPTAVLQFCVCVSGPAVANGYTESSLEVLLIES